MNEAEPNEANRGASPDCESPAVSSFNPAWAFALAVPLLLIALSLQNVTLAGGSYGPVLLTALVLTGLADACFIYAFRRGGVFARSLSVICLLPTLWVVSDLLRRAPYVFAQ